VSTTVVEAPGEVYEIVAAKNELNADIPAIPAADRVSHPKTVGLTRRYGSGFHAALHIEDATSPAVFQCVCAEGVPCHFSLARARLATC
jgi:hypothetical protein